MNKFIQILLGISITFMTAMAIAEPLPPLSIKMENDSHTDIELSSTDINRLFIDGDKIISINAPQHQLIAENDPSGSIYVHVTNKVPFTAFLTTQAGRHFSLLIIPKNKPGVTLRVVPTTPIRGIRRHSIANRFERSTPYEKALIDLIRTVMQQKNLSGYSAIPPKDFNQMSIFQLPSSFNGQSTLQQQIVSGFVGGALAVRIVKLTNNSAHSIHLKESHFYQPGVRAIAIDKETLSPQQFTFVYEVISNA